MNDADIESFIRTGSFNHSKRNLFLLFIKPRRVQRWQQLGKISQKSLMSFIWVSNHNGLQKKS